ncbi:MAG: winged helix-turn-helix domain-containing protein, partial [Acidobacteriaceae bacterium]|nr:winged helix-turn-helix domain-containing protein [Acidobacteriaceae bacterium]
MKSWDVHAPDEHGWIADRPIWIYNCFDVRRKAVSLSVGTSHHSSVLRFGVFEMDLALGELRKNGIPVKLPPQPFKVLALLATHRGQVVTREEIQQQIWGSDTFVDFEQWMNHCIKQIRNVLSDSAETPRFVETLPRRGYRFIAPVEQPEAG